MRRALKWLVVAVVGYAVLHAALDSGSAPQVVRTTVVEAPAAVTEPIEPVEPREPKAKPRTYKTPAPPPSLKRCDANIRVKALTTSCEFASNVFYEYYEAEGSE